jgi:hypothetical protein
MVDDATAAAGYAANKKAFELGQAIAGQHGSRDPLARVRPCSTRSTSSRRTSRTRSTLKKEQVKLIGELFSKELAKGIRSAGNGDPVVRAQAREERTAALNELQSRSTAARRSARRPRRPRVPGASGRGIRRSARQRRQLAKIIDGRFDAAARDPPTPPAVSGRQRVRERCPAAITARMQAGINIHVNAYIYHDNGKGNAVGGWATAGVPTWVNEHTTNSEIFVPSTSGRFLTHAEAMNALHQGGGAPINITINAGGDVSPVAAHRFGQLVVHEVAAAFRQGGARRGISTSVRP